MNIKTRDNVNCSDAIIISVIFTFSTLCKQQIEAVVNVSLFVSSDCKGETKVSVLRGISGTVSY